jgi:hypothetical protein
MVTEIFALQYINRVVIDGTKTAQVTKILQPLGSAVLFLLLGNQLRS